MLTILTSPFVRWYRDLRRLGSGVLLDPFAQKSKLLWQNDFLGEIDNDDIRHAIAIGVMSLIPAAIVAFVASSDVANSEAKIKVMAEFFAAPVRVIVTGMLTSFFLFLGAHANRVPRAYSIAFKLMLRVMAAYPLLCFLGFSRWGVVASLLVHGFFVIRGVCMTYAIPLRNAFLFYGIIYTMFALMQAQAILKPHNPDPLKNFSKVLPANRTVASLGMNR